MSMAFDFRELAEEQRRMAQETPLLMVRLKHLAAAEKWDLMAKESEWCARRAPESRHPDLFY